MFLMRFTERAYTAYTEQEVRDSFRSLVRLRVPTLVVWGRNDMIVPMDRGELYHQAIPGSRLEL